MNDILQDLDFILIMTVNPGWEGQSFIDSCLVKIAKLKSWIKGQQLPIPIEVDGGVNLDNIIPIEVDGGVNLDNIEKVIKAGAEIIVAGSAVFHAPQPNEVVIKMKELSKRAVSK